VLVPIVMCNLEIDRDLISVVVPLLRFCSPKNSVLQLLCLAPVLLFFFPSVSLLSICKPSYCLSCYVERSLLVT